ncbi:MAG: hypothetical protein LKJ25_05860 [Clostridia bacterium]|jgi:hypothetical protein|nr:hypothetical protein [Clostridia bacterium]
MDIANLINTFGFPTACVIACGFFILKMWEQQNADKEKLYVELDNSRTATEKALDVIQGYSEKLNIIESDVKEIKEKVVG